MKKNRLLLLLLLLSNFLYAQLLKKSKNQGEIIYHICQRSFYDSNGDSHGDLNGLRQKLPYLQDLGVTSILLFPLFESDCYHNYFANNFEQIDPEFGTMQDYLDLVKEVHQRGMKIYLDMETQYVTSEHFWWKDAVGNLNSPYSDFILFEDDAHLTPATMVFDLRILNGYDGKVITATTVNLKSKKVLDYNIQLFSYFMDPNKDGKFVDGVDGFRLDHAMDHLDGKPTLTNLFATFWKPLIQSLKEINPTINIVAEQANWEDYGFEYFEKAGVDRMFGFGLQQAILSFDKDQIIKNAEIIFLQTPQEKEQIIFIENHDIDRFASIETNFEKQKTAAALMLLIGGVPSIYYGQEIGMRGKVYSFGNTDGNDIGRREAFEWYASREGEGMASWYKNSGPWWESANTKPSDGISFEEQRNDPQSLYYFYFKTIHLRQNNPALSVGAYQNLPNDNPAVLSFYRVSNKQKVLVIVNLSDKQQDFHFQHNIRNARNLLSESTVFSNHLLLKPYEFQVWDVSKYKSLF